MTYIELDWTTDEGLFRADTGERFWVWNERYHKRVIRLDETNGAPFTFVDLWGPGQMYAPRGARRTTFIKGTWLGPVTLEVGEPSDKTFINACGIIIKSNFRVYLKAREAYRTSIRLAVPSYELDLYERWSIFYPDWSLILEAGDIPAVHRLTFSTLKRSFP